MKRKVIDLDFLLKAKDYELELYKMNLFRDQHFDIDMYFHGSYNPTNLLIDDPSRDYFLIRFKEYAVFLGTLQEHGHHDEGLANSNPIVKLDQNSIFHSFSDKEMRTNILYTDRGTLTHYVVRTFDQEFHVLAYEDPVVIDYTDKKNKYEL